MKAQRTQFSPEARTNLTIYVYALIDPRKSKDDPRRVFYVGKGVRNRCFQHATLERRWAKQHDDLLFKLQTIRDIRREKKMSPPILILRHGLTEAEASVLEAVFIKFLKTHQIAGHHDDNYCLSIDEIEGVYSSNPIKIEEFKGSILIVSLHGNKGDLVPFPQIPDQDYSKRTLGYWPVAPSKAARVHLVIGVYDQLIRLVYRTSKTNDGKTRFRRINFGTKRKALWKIQFTAERDSNLENCMRNRRIADSDGDVLTRFDWPQTSAKFIDI